eukprot:GHVS01038694.1.p1 GENE.GHVS01038694.1~~GHVS01038694.1.p1  ORF type:complete len:410 (+),score=64.64 GHVS01038694.1:76-1305(+)
MFPPVHSSSSSSLPRLLRFLRQDRSSWLHPSIEGPCSASPAGLVEVVLGNATADLDSISCSIALAYLIPHIRQTDSTLLEKPPSPNIGAASPCSSSVEAAAPTGSTSLFVINCSRAELPLRLVETAWLTHLFSTNNISGHHPTTTATDNNTTTSGDPIGFVFSDWFLFLEDVEELFSSPPLSCLSITLVDHNAVDHPLLRPHVCRVIDHHADAHSCWNERIYINNPGPCIGSCATLITEMYMQFQLSHPHQFNMAADNLVWWLLLGPIIKDCCGLDPALEGVRWSRRDKLALHWLLEMLQQPFETIAAVMRGFESIRWDSSKYLQLVGWSCVGFHSCYFCYSCHLSRVCTITFEWISNSSCTNVWTRLSSDVVTRRQIFSLVRCSSTTTTVAMSPQACCAGVKKSNSMF